MSKNKKNKVALAKWPLSCILGILIIIISWGSVLISVLLAPPPFSPLTNYLSSLGNSTYNPNGAIIYNSSVIVTGFLFLIFFIGFYNWYTDIKLDKILLIAIQTVGCLLSITIVLTGFLSEDFKPQHVFWSIVAGILGFLAQVSIAYYLIRQKDSIKKISYSIFGLMGLYIILLFILSPQHVLTEWVVRSVGDITLVLMIFNLKHIYQVRNKLNS
ncbi:MAG: DUF998 domain-containing protein [Promethearchaeota archaeon]|nr:MAG: DUF998 domain-containing protein [Candidatus Lokiarchaeota archaeon]